MTHDDAARWLDAYVEAWRSYDPAAIGALFADDAEYRYHPWDEPLRGRDAIVASWTGDQDAPGLVGGRGTRRGPSTATGSWRPARAATWTRKRTYHNVFLIEFDDAGTATSFTEVFAQER